VTLILAILVAARDRALGEPHRARNARAAVVLCLVVGAFAALATPALSATEGSPSPSEVRAQRMAVVLAEREARLALKRAEVEQRRQRLREERASRVALKRSADSGGTRQTTETKYGWVEISCASVTWHYREFGEGTHTVTQVVTIDGAPQPLTPYTFSGPEGEDTTPIAESASRHSIDARARWDDNGTRGSWDRYSTRTCGAGGSSPAYTIEKRQRIIGSGHGFVTEQLTGEVGQTIEYSIVITNTGGVPLTFSAFTDPRCDPATLTGAVEGSVAPGASVDLKCTHVITPADQQAGSYENMAMVTGTPTLGGTPVTTPTNTVVVHVPPVSQSTTPPPGSRAPETPTTGSQGVLGTRGSLAPGAGGGAGGGLATSATVPAISGVPRGCARSNFVIRVRARGVRSAVFYIDNRRVRTLTARNARAGMLTLHVTVTKLKLGVHHIKVRITMTPLTASTKAVVATRTLTFAHCAAAKIVGPRFTG
jgi:hypothetical protein